jgi:tRNA pseudouridine38-40 synthase
LSLPFTIHHSPFTTKKVQTWKLEIEYEGTRYRGWQIQQNARTVQGEIERAAKEFFDTGLLEIGGSGRTDAGVHAKSQIAHLRVFREFEDVTPRSARFKRRSAARH